MLLLRDVGRAEGQAMIDKSLDRLAEHVLLIALAGFVLSQSYFYAGQMLRIGRTSDMAGVPMWIPHGSVALGFVLIALTAGWRLVAVMTRCEPQRAAPADGQV